MDALIEATKDGDHSTVGCELYLYPRCGLAKMMMKEKKISSKNKRRRKVQILHGHRLCDCGTWRGREGSVTLYQLRRCWLFDLHHMSRIWDSTQIPRLQRVQRR